MFPSIPGRSIHRSDIRRTLWLRKRRDNSVTGPGYQIDIGSGALPGAGEVCVPWRMGATVA